MGDKFDYDYTNRHDILRLAARVSRLPARQFNYIAPYIVATDLMKPFFLMRWAVKFIKWRHRLPEARAWHVLHGEMMKRGTDIFADLKLALVQHIIKGNDTYDERSAGGFCKQEVDTLVDLVNAAEAM